MITRLAITDIKEMTMEIPDISFSQNNDIEYDNFIIENTYADASFKTIRTPLYSITDAQMKSHENLKVYSSTGINDYIWFCAALNGNITSICNQYKEEKWKHGQANILIYNDIKGCTCFTKNVPFRMLEIMLSTRYIENLSELYPNFFNDILAKHKKQEFLKANPDNIPFCPQINMAIKDILNYEILGNIAPMYLDAKIMEILSLFISTLDKKKCDLCDFYSTKDNDLFLHAKEIIEQHYLHPLSIPQLAHQVGINECKLKKGFKILFGTTIFGYLFDYRMEMACRYLSDTDKNVQEIAELIGYEHHSHFSTAFKRKFCISPVEYRGRKEK
jgi:AraC-like DNA-binding protein